MIWLAAFIATIPAANWLIHNWGTVCPDICLVPVGFGLMAPSGVVMAGLALCLRDLVHRQMGPLWSVAGILVGAALSFFVASPHVAVASAVAFLLSELADFAVYAPLARKRFFTAMLLSGAVGLIVDSALFLQLAFGSLEYIEGQLIAKAYAVAGATALIWLYRRKLDASENRKATPLHGR